MLVKKWVIVRKLEDIALLGSLISPDDISVCWAPDAVFDMEVTNAIIYFQNFSYYSKIALGLNDNFYRNLEKKERELFISNLTRLLFQPSYYKKNNSPFIVDLAEQEHECQELWSEINARLLAQGIQDLKIITSRKTVYCAKTPFYMELVMNLSSFNYESFFEQWADLVTQTANAEYPFIFIEPIDLLSTAEYIDFINSKENDFSMRSKTYALSLLMCKLNEKEIQKNKELNNFATDNKNQSDFLRIQKTQSQEILTWYHNEYEILPLWYKRFGHIIKVIMGKRSFKSLYKDNVKKYKD